MANQISQLARKVCREVAGCGRRYYPPVKVVDGDARPHMAGEHFYHTTPSGKTIVHLVKTGWFVLYTYTDPHGTVGVTDYPVIYATELDAQAAMVRLAAVGWEVFGPERREYRVQQEAKSNGS